MIDLKGFKQIIPTRKGRVSKYANCLLVLEKSKRFSLGKELYDKYKLDKQKKAGLYIKKAKQFYEIIVGFKDDEMFMLSKTPGDSRVCVCHRVPVVPNATGRVRARGKRDNGRGVLHPV